MKLNLELQMAGRFLLEAVGPDGDVRRSTGWFDNIITDSGLNGIAARNMIAACWCGTGSTTPTALDTSLVAFVGATSTVIGDTAVAQSSAPYYGSRTRTYEFAVGVATGNISEVGIASGTNVGTSFLFSRALVLDGGGSPTTITVLSDEKLRVTYELRCYPPTSDVVTSETINGVSTTVTVRAANVTSSSNWALNLGAKVGDPSKPMTLYSGAIGAITAQPSGGSLGSNQMTLGSYSSGSFTINGTGFFDTGAANGTTTAATFSLTYGLYQIGFSPGIVKTNLQTLTMVVSITWARKTLP